MKPFVLLSYNISLNLRQEKGKLINVFPTSHRKAWGCVGYFFKEWEERFADNSAE